MNFLHLLFLRSKFARQVIDSCLATWNYKEAISNATINIMEISILSSSLRMNVGNMLSTCKWNLITN